MDALAGNSLGVGIGLRAAHYQDFRERRPAVDWLEVHTENHFNHASRDAQALDLLRRDYPISLHGVGLAIGSAVGFFERHLERIAEVVNRVEPVLISEHLCWGTIGTRHFNDLLPLPFTEETLAFVCRRVDQVQERLGRQILLENVSTFLRFKADTATEAAYLAAVARRTGCGILLDINNLYVNQRNHGEDAATAISGLPIGPVREFHLGGHLETSDACIDHHGARIATPVWALYREAVHKFGAVPTLIEWDTDVPELDVLLDEVRLARQCIATAAIEATNVDRISMQASFPDSATWRGTSMADLQQTMAHALSEPVLQASAVDLFQGANDQITERLALYRGNLVATWNKALVAAYPVLQALVGEAFFGALAGEYGRAHPSTSGDLHLFGAQLADFLEGFAPVAAYPYFPAMAQLEWLLHQVAHLPAGVPIDARVVAGLSPEALDAARFTLRPDCRLFESAFGVVSLWRLHQTSSEAALTTWIDRPERALVLHRSSGAMPISLTHAEFVALEVLGQGQPLGHALDAALELDPDFDFAGCLKTWLMDGLFVGVNGNIEDAGIGPAA